MRRKEKNHQIPRALVVHQTQPDKKPTAQATA
jgi:hypothetical protein